MSSGNLARSLFALCLWATQAAAPAVAAVPATYTLEAVRAYFYFQESGRFGELDLLSPKRTLWNTPVGGGDAQKPSTVTLITVTISGPWFGRGTTGAIQLRASTSSRDLSTQSVPLSELYAGSGRVTVPFLVFGTGCEKLELKIQMSGVRAEPREIRKKVPFVCGE